MILGSYAVYPMGYYELQPQYECRHYDFAQNDWAAWKTCTNAKFCPNLESEQDKDYEAVMRTKDPYKFLPQHQLVEDSPTTLHNWVEKFKMTCEPNSSFGYFGSVFFLGVSLSSLILPRLSDLIGRRQVAIAGNLVHFIGGKIIFLSTSMWLTVFSCFIQGFGFGGRVFIGYIWMTENMDTTDIPFATCLMFFFDALCLFVCSIYFKHVSKDWKPLYGVTMAAGTIFMVCLMFQANSPKLNYAVGEYKEARRLLTNIGRRNGALRPKQRYKKIFKIEVEEEEENEEEEDKSTMKYFFKSSSNKKNLLIFTVMYFACSYCYYLINLYMKYLTGDIYVNQITNSLSEAVSCIFPLLMLKRISVKSSFTIAFLVSMVSCVVIMIAEHGNYAALSPIGILGAKAGINVAFCFLYIGSINFFDNQFLGLQMGICNTIGRLGSAAAPLVAEVGAPTPMISCISVCVLAMAASAFLKQPEHLR